MIGRLIQQQDGGLQEESPGQRHSHPPASTHITRVLAHVRSTGTSNLRRGESQTSQDDGGARLEGGRVQRVLSLVYVVERLCLRSRLDHDLLHEVLQANHLFTCTLNNVIKGRLLQRRGFMSQQVDVVHLRNGHLSGGEALQEGGFTATVSPQQTVPSAVMQLDDGVLHQACSMQGEGERCDLHVSGSGLGGQQTGGYASLIIDSCLCKHAAQHCDRFSGGSGSSISSGFLSVDLAGLLRGSLSSGRHFGCSIQ